MKRKQNEKHSTEEKIKDAARSEFHKKGFAGARTRDIAEGAGTNTALLNYYFRSKGKLFQIIIEESLQHFIQNLREAINDENSSIEEKVESIVDKYTELFLEQPDIILFVLSELRSNPDRFVSRFNPKELLTGSVFYRQIQEKCKGKPIAEPFNFFLNILGMTLFPFITSPVVKHITGENDFESFVQQRKKLIPLWVKSMLES